MPAYNIKTRTHDFVGQVVAVDIEENKPGDWSSEKLYFVVSRQVRLNHIFTKIYCREYYGPVWADEWIPGGFDVTFNNAIVDAPQNLIEAFRHSLEIEKMYVDMLNRIENCCIIQKGDDIGFSVHKKPMVGYVHQILPGRYTHSHSIKNGRYQVMETSTGEVYSFNGADKLRLLNPLSRLKGKVACLDCKNIWNDWASMKWCRNEEISRPMCGMCQDVFLDRGIELEKQLDGPYNFKKDISILACGWSDVWGVHGVL